jgi:YgiT-type zinc finger domain-containing protein
MNCASCGGTATQGTTTVTVQRGDTTVVVRGVPALICDVCGDEYIDEPTLRRVERLVDEAAASGATMVVHEYAGV